MRAYVLFAVLIIGGLAALVVSLGSHVTYSILNGNLASLWNGSTEEAVTAEAYVIMRLDSGAVIEEKNKDTVYPIASVSKLFTAAALVRSDLLESETLIVWQDFVTEGSSGSLWLGETYTLRDLLFPLLLSSSNDAATAILRGMGKETHDALQNEILKDAGLSHTELADASGLDDRNTSTAFELAKFLVYLDTHYRYVLDITTLSSYMGPYHGWINNNPGMAFDSFRGGKHGYTYAAGRTFAGIFEKNGDEYGIVLLQSSDLPGDIGALLARLP